MKNLITEDMFIQEIIQKYPETVKVFKEYNLDCVHCQIAEFEEISHGARVHHITPEELLEKLNSVVSDKSR